MPVLRSSVDTASETYRRNRQVQLAAVAALNQQLESARREAESAVGNGALLIERFIDNTRQPVWTGR
jgi:pyruvate carboxylase